MESTDEQRQAFAAALARQLEGRPRSTFAAEVAAASGESVSENAISLWLQGKSEPTRSKVFAIERVLRLAPGALSRLLGYVPAKGAAGTSVPDAIRADTRLGDLAREMLIASFNRAIRDEP